MLELLASGMRIEKLLKNYQDLESEREDFLAFIN